MTQQLDSLVLVLTYSIRYPAVGHFVSFSLSIKYVSTQLISRGPKMKIHVTK